MVSLALSSLRNRPLAFRDQCGSLSRSAELQRLSPHRFYRDLTLIQQAREKTPIPAQPFRIAKFGGRLIGVGLYVPAEDQAEDAGQLFQSVGVEA